MVINPSPAIISLHASFFYFLFHFLYLIFSPPLYSSYSHLEMLLFTYVICQTYLFFSECVWTCGGGGAEMEREGTKQTWA